MLRSILKLDPLKAARYMFYLNAATWFGLAIFSLVHMASANPEFALTYQIVAALMFANAAAMLISGYMITKQRMSWYLLALGLLLVNIILTFTDEFGFFDFITFTLDLVILAVLIGSWRKFLSSEPI